MKAEDYGVTNDNASATIGETWNLVDCKSKFPDAFRWAQDVKGKPDDWTTSLTGATAAAIDGVWSGNGSGFNPQVTCTSRNRILMPNGYSMVNYPIPVSYGGLIGYGNGWAGKNGNNVSYLKCDHDRWVGDKSDRTVMRSVNWDTDDYLEGALVDGVHIDGGAGLWVDPSYHQSGLELRMIGEGVNVGTRDGIYISACNNHGLDLYGSGPGNIGTISSFDCNEAGMYHHGGGSLGLLTMVMLSMDNNGIGYYSDGGGGFVLGAMKCENNLSLSRDKAPKQMPAIYARGLIGIEVGMIRYSMGKDTWIPAPIILEHNAGGSMLDVRKFMIHQDSNSGVDKIILCSASGRAYAIKDMQPWHYYPIHWEAEGNIAEVSSGKRTIVSEPWGGHGRLGVITSLKEVDYAKATPVWDPTGGTASSPAPTPDPTPVPPVVPPVVTPPEVDPRAKGVIAEFEQGDPVLTNISPTAYYPVNWPAVSRVEIKGLRWAGTPNYQALFGGPRVVVRAYPDGSVKDSRGKVLAPKGTVKDGIPVDLTLILDPMDVTYFGATPLTGNAWKGTMDGLTIYCQ
jgi:hypothetical protein